MAKPSQKTPRTLNQELDFPVFEQKSMAELGSKENQSLGLAGNLHLCPWGWIFPDLLDLSAELRGKQHFRMQEKIFFLSFLCPAWGNAEPDPGNLAPLVSQGGLRVGAIPPLSRPKMSIRIFGMFLGG